MLVDLFESHEEDPNTYLSFIMFEPASLRIPENDILLVQDQVPDFFDKIINCNKFNDTLQDQILLNRLRRIEMMLDLLKTNDGLIMTKFLNKIWRRYAFFSNLGELFISKKEVHRLLPDYSFNESPILDRVVESFVDEDTQDKDTDDDDTNKDSKEDKDDKDDKDEKVNQS